MISQTTAILQYLAWGTDLLGKTAFESAQVDQWMSVLRSETWPLTKTLAAFVFGSLDCDTQEHTHIYNLMKENIKVINNALKSRQFMVGDSLTIVDLQIALCTSELQQMVMDTNFRNSLNNLNAHFKLVTDLPIFKGRMGNLR